MCVLVCVYQSAPVPHFKIQLSARTPGHPEHWQMLLLPPLSAGIHIPWALKSFWACTNRTKQKDRGTKMTMKIYGCWLCACMSYLCVNGDMFHILHAKVCALKGCVWNYIFVEYLISLETTMALVWEKFPLQLHSIVDILYISGVIWNY